MSFTASITLFAVVGFLCGALAGSRGWSLARGVALFVIVALVFRVAGVTA